MLGGGGAKKAKSSLLLGFHASVRPRLHQDFFPISTGGPRRLGLTLGGREEQEERRATAQEASRQREAEVETIYQNELVAQRGQRTCSSMRSRPLDT